MSQLKELIEETYSMNDNMKVVLLCHSFGGTNCLHFLHQQNQTWKDQYIVSLFSSSLKGNKLILIQFIHLSLKRFVITLGTPFAGAAASVVANVIGDNYGLFLIGSSRMRNIQRSFSSAAALNPDPRVFNPMTDIFVETPNKNYTAFDLNELYQDIQHPDGYEMWLDSAEANKMVFERHPGVKVHCWVGIGVPTQEKIVYKKQEDFPEKNPEIIYGEGDGTVNFKSARQCLRWIDESGEDTLKKSLLEYREFNNVEHFNLVTDDSVINALKDVLKL